MRALFIINPHAAGGYALEVWRKLEAQARRDFAEVQTLISRSSAELPAALDAAADQGLQAVVSIGGDGSSHSLVNALMRQRQARPQVNLAFGCVPAGTGRDWARGVDTALNPAEALRRIALARPRLIDVGHLRYDGRDEYFLNIATAGISALVVKYVDQAKPRRPWTFLRATLRSLFNYRSQPMQISLDDQPWYAGPVYLAAIANGRYFGQGMDVAPHARFDDGLLEVVVAEDLRLAQALGLLARLYRGAHLSHPRVRYARARQVSIHSLDGQLIGMDLDGEPAFGQRLSYALHAQALSLLA
ncbi:MAG: diacylglycerol kinase family lipid kinase [Anaerolineae bacterium]|nr:diacylglycerol kinase family lipid kinase [Anaerolineae bacterium]MDW8172931.1 diacylglycerol kinase family lipid kinase [Anaerolineae bacterium]